MEPPTKAHTNFISIFYDTDEKVAYCANVPSHNLHLSMTSLKTISQYLTTVIDEAYCIVVLHYIVNPVEAVTLTILEHTNEQKIMELRQRVDVEQLKPFRQAITKGYEQAIAGDGKLKAHILEIRFENEDDILSGNIVFINGKKRVCDSFVELSSFCSFLNLQK